MVNGLDHSVTESTMSVSISSESSLSSEPMSTVPPYIITAGTTSSTTVVNNIESTLSNTFPTSTNNVLPSEEETAVQAVRNHVESLKHPGQ